jgi:hypothetical protein
LCRPCLFAIEACTAFGGVFLLVLLIFRMTHKLLQAIEVSGRRA